jgi:hypothetical protein
MLDNLPENLAELVEFPTPTKAGSMLELQDPREVGKQRAIERPRSRDPWLNSSEARRMIERLTPRTLDELDEEPDPDWLIDRHLPEVRRLRIFGQQDKLRANRSKGCETWA